MTNIFKPELFILITCMSLFYTGHNTAQTSKVDPVQYILKANSDSINRKLDDTLSIVIAKSDSIKSELKDEREKTKSLADDVKKVLNAKPKVVVVEVIPNDTLMNMKNGSEPISIESDSTYRKLKSK